MRNLSKNKNLIISILLFIAFVAGAFCAVFLPTGQSVYADNYGEIQPAGNYLYHNVSFYAIKIRKGENYKEEEDSGNFPTNYDLSLKGEEIQTVKYDETVLLEDNEMLLISFARQDRPSNDKEQALAGTKTNDTFTPYSPVDFLDASLKFNGNSPVEALIGQNAGSTSKFFAYVVSFDKEGNEEGLVQFGADYQEISGAMAHFDFKFYVFNKSTYQREELYNNTLRPNTSISADYVVDRQNASKFYGEYFYNYEDQNLVTLTYNPLRYELEISKTIHSASTKYNFSYDIEKGEVVYSNTPSLATNEVYCRDLAFKKDGDNVVITFKDLGVYQISYKAVYYNQNNTKTYLESLNNEFNKEDRLTIFGVQATYNDYQTHQTEFRNAGNSISADITGNAILSKFLNVSGTTDISLTDVELGSIAASNQPQIEFLFDANISGNFNVYKYKLEKESNNYKLTKASDFDLSSKNPKLTESGYYFVSVTYTFDRYKEWLGSSSNTNTTKSFTQYFLFRIKDQTPTIDVKDEHNNFIMSGYYDENNIYHGSFTSGTVSISNSEEQTDFDLPTTITLQKKDFNSNLDWQNVDFDETIDVSSNGHYRLIIKFGNNSTTMRYFDVDKEEISNVRALNVAPATGSQYYEVDDEAYAMNGNKVFTTSKPFTLMWNDKASGAKINASYVRYSMDNSKFSNTANEYILNEGNGYVAADSKISINALNPTTSYNKANSIEEVSANEVLSLPGLYVFTISDEAGNNSKFYIILDNSTPTILQATYNDAGISAMDFKIINSFNNIASKTMVYFGKKKLVLLDGLDVSNLGNLKCIFEDEEILNSRFVKIGDNYYAYFDITGAEKANISTGEKENITNLQDGYDIVNIKSVDGIIVQESFLYSVTDESLNVKNHSVSVNTEKTGLAVYYSDENVDFDLIAVTTKTDSDNSKIIKYLRSTSADLVFVTWDTLRPTDLDAFVDLENKGLIINFYEIKFEKFDEDNGTYTYATEPTRVINVASIADAIAKSGEKFSFALNSVDGKTLAGKYEIVRTYKAKNSEDDSNLKSIVSPDFIETTLVFYVDRNNVVTAPNALGESVGSLDYVKFFDGVDNKEKPFNQLFKQSQAENANPVIRTNKLPVGIYIPVSQYGYLDGSTFVDNTKVSVVDYGKVAYTPFATKVSVKTPVLNGRYAVYLYNKDVNGYWKLSSYEIYNISNECIESGNIDASSVITRNVLTNGYEYHSGEYELIISSLVNPNVNAKNAYLHNFVFKFEVVNDSPEFSVTAQFENLPSMDENTLKIANDGKFYTNADKLYVSWENSSSEYFVKIDENLVECEFNNGRTLKVDASGNDKITVENNSFVVNLPVLDIISGLITRIDITMSFEVYGSNPEIAKYFAGNHTITKTIVFDRKAPNQAVESLRTADSIVGTNTNVNISAVRTVGDRFNISSDAGIYGYYSFATDVETLKTILFNNSSMLETTEVFIRKIDNKYSGNNAVEIGSPLDPSASPSNVFNWQIANADTQTWKYANSKSGLEEAFNDGVGYYEIVELDYAGNTTIYSVYIKEQNSDIKVSYSFIDKDGKESSSNKTFSGEFEVNSFEQATLESVEYDSSDYGYLMFVENGVKYLITPQNAEGYAFRIKGDSQSEIALEDIELVSSNSYVFTINNAISGENLSLVFNVSDVDDELDVSLEKDSVTQNGDIGINVRNKSSIYVKELNIYALNKSTNVITTYSKDSENQELKVLQASLYSGSTTYYIANKGDWNNFVFLIVYEDNFGRQNHILTSYLDVKFDRYIGSADLTENMQSLSSILVSAKDYIWFNEKIDSQVEIFVRYGLSDVYSVYSLEDKINNTNDGYFGYKLDASPVTVNNSSFYGGVVEYKIVVRENLSDFNNIDIDQTESKEYSVTIYNQTPSIVLRNAKGEDITEALFNKTQTHSGKLFISYIPSNEISENYGFTSVVMLKKRGSSEGYVEIPSSYSISEAGTYDIKVVNRNSNGELAYSFEKQFLVANYDVNFYSVVAYDANNSENPYRVIEPTGKTFKVNDETVNYHYIINTSTYEISVNNGVVAKLQLTKTEGLYTTYLYSIESQIADIGSSIKFSRKIAITVLNANNNILGNSLSYYLGDNPEDVVVNSITTANKDIFIYKADEYNFVTIEWNSYYVLPQNKIFYQISDDGGKTFSDKIESGDEQTTKLVLSKSGNYVLIFSDLAGNVQTISESSGVKDRYKINFVKSVIFLVNDENPIDNAVYNDDVIISIPSSTLSYYQAEPKIYVLRNGEEYSISKNKAKVYEFTQAGRYVVYFTATKGDNEIGIEKTTFTIINPNDSRWAFSYQNYNGYTIDYIKYNGTDFDLTDVALNDEIVMSVIGENALDNGIYTIKMSTKDIPSKSFEFSVWLNSTTPSIVVSLAEGTTTTGDVEFKLNTLNLYDMVGDCVVMVNDQEVLVINSEYFESESFAENFTGKMTETGVYYIQVYTSSDKLIYSYRVEIVDPLNTVTIILIVVGSVAVVVGAVLFILLRKKLRIR